MPTNKPPVRPQARNTVYDVVDGEVDHLDETLPPDLPAGEYFTMLAVEVRKARELHLEGVPEGMEHSHNRLRRIAGLAVRAMGAFGPVPREYHVPASAGITGTLNVINVPDQL